MWSGVTVQTMMASSSGGVDAALRQRAPGGLHRHVGSRHLRIRDVALADAGALQDPLVVGIDHLFQILVGEHARRRCSSPAR